MTVDRIDRQCIRLVGIKSKYSSKECMFLAGSIPTKLKVLAPLCYRRGRTTSIRLTP